MLAGPKPRIFTFLSATPDDEKSALLVNLSASLVKSGNQVLLFDARSGSRGVSSRLDMPHGATLQEVARQERALNEAVRSMPQGFSVATLARGRRIDAGDELHARRLATTFRLLATQADILVVDGELDDDDNLPISVLATGEIIIQVSTSATSIKTAYTIVKRLNAQLGRRPFGILVTGANEQEAQVVYDNMSRASNRYLAVQLRSLGSVPADEHVRRAARLGRTVVDAFPLAGASVAFRRLAGRVAAPEMTSGLGGMATAGANLVI